MRRPLLPCVPIRLGAPLQWGNSSIAAGSGKRYMSPGFTDQTAPTVPHGTFRSPRQALLQRFRARHNDGAGNGNDVVYDIEVNGVPQGLALTLATGAVGDAEDLVTRLTILEGDLLDVTVTKASPIGTADVQAMFVCEYV